MLKIFPKLLLTGLFSSSLLLTGAATMPELQETSEQAPTAEMSEISFAEPISDTDEVLNPSIIVLEKSDNQKSPVQYEEEFTIIPETLPEEYTVSEKDLIFVGDSRTVGMQYAINSDACVIAEVGKGYNWLTNTADTQLRNEITDHSIVIFNLGVNDLRNISKYEDYLATLSADYPNLKIYVVSVNPVDNYPTVSNEEIEAFNAAISSYGTSYIDTYNQLISNGFETCDGLHYTNTTYQHIYEQIVSSVL